MKIEELKADDLQIGWLYSFCCDADLEPIENEKTLRYLRECITGWKENIQNDVIRYAFPTSEAAREYFAAHPSEACHPIIPTPR